MKYGPITWWLHERRRRRIEKEQLKRYPALRLVQPTPREIFTIERAAEEGLFAGDARYYTEGYANEAEYAQLLDVIRENEKRRINGK